MARGSPRGPRIVLNYLLGKYPGVTPEQFRYCRSHGFYPERALEYDFARLCHVHRGAREAWPDRLYAAAISRHVANAFDRSSRKVRREVRWRWTLKWL